MEKQKTSNDQDASSSKEVFQVSQKLLLYNSTEKKFLIVKDASDYAEVVKKYGSWELPGGRVEKNEDPQEAFGREIQEELGSEITYELAGTVASTFYLLSDINRILVVYLGMYQGGNIALSSEHSEHRWQTAEEIEKNPDYFPWLKEVIKTAENRLKETSDLEDLKRVTADFENYKKRQSQEKDEVGKYMVNTVVSELIPILDNFHMAVEHVPEDKRNDPWVTGITYIEKQFEEVLSRYGVKVMEVKAGDTFDTTKHEAIEDVSSIKYQVSSKEKETTEDMSSEVKKIIVEKVLQKGYEMNGKVIRVAKVNVISK